jgi:hypothetical protein
MRKWKKDYRAKFLRFNLKPSVPVSSNPMSFISPMVAVSRCSSRVSRFRCFLWFRRPSLSSFCPSMRLRDLVLPLELSPSPLPRRHSPTSFPIPLPTVEIRTAPDLVAKRSMESVSANRIKSILLRPMSFPSTVDASSRMSHINGVSMSPATDIRLISA